MQMNGSMNSVYLFYIYFKVFEEYFCHFEVFESEKLWQTEICTETKGFLCITTHLNQTRMIYIVLIVSAKYRLK